MLLALLFHHEQSSRATDQALTYSVAQAPVKKANRRKSQAEVNEGFDWNLYNQIDDEDETVLALVMAAAPILGAKKWRQ